jgi:hypothetical protein
MKNKSMARILPVVTLVMIVCCLLALGVSAVAQSGNTSAASQSGGQRCSNRTLSGSYGYSSQGQVLPAPGVALSFTSTGRANFDGKGNVSWVEHTVIGGMQQGADWTASTSGTYTVNSDCTGSMVATTPNSPVPLNLFFSLVQQGKQFYSVVNGHAITGVWTRVD